MEIRALGIDLAKSVFQLHGVDAEGAVVLRRKLRRGAVLDVLRSLPPCLIGMEACGPLASLGARDRGARARGPADPACLRQAVCDEAEERRRRCGGKSREAVSRPSMRFVPIKSPEQQSVLMLHRSRDLLMRQRTMLLNAIRAHLTEFGIITAQGPAKVLELVAQLRTGEALGLPDIVRSALLSLTAQLDSLALGIRSLERQLMAWHRSNTASQRLEAIPGVGLLTATALAASVPDPTVFHSGRQFAAYLGLVPRQNSSGGKERLGRISKMGNGALRRLLVVGTTSVIRKAGSNATRTGAWVRSLLERKPARLTTVAVANSERGGATGSSVPRTARIAWALRARGDGYRSGAPA